MKKSARIASDWYDEGWPEPEDIERYFLAPRGKQWFGREPRSNDAGAFWIEGADGTEDLPENEGRIYIDLSLWGHPDLGVLLIYWKRGGGSDETYSSAGDLAKLGEIFRANHGTKLPVGLFIPFEEAWKAVREFLETDGQLPKSIQWIANKDLPPNTFPPP
jgi:hypothetical protein